MAMPSRLDFSEEKKRAWLRGDTIPAMPFTITEDDGDTPVDLTGAQIVMDIYERIDGAVLARLRTSNAPAIGGGKIDFDYYHVVAFSRYSDMGATMEMYTNAGGQAAQREILDKVSSCGQPIAFDALSVRDHDER